MSADKLYLLYSVNIINSVLKMSEFELTFNITGLQWQWERIKVSTGTFHLLLISRGPAKHSEQTQYNQLPKKMQLPS